LPEHGVLSRSTRSAGESTAGQEYTRRDTARVDDRTDHRTGHRAADGSSRDLSTALSLPPRNGRPAYRADYPTNDRCWVPVLINEDRRVVGRVDIAMERRRLIDLAEEAVLGEKSSQLGIEVSSFRVVEAGFGVEDVASEGEAVGALCELCGESEVAPGILGNY
jgi:hypothetical protein